MGNHGVIVAAANVPWREKLCRALAPHMPVLAQTGTADGAVRLSRSLCPDVLVAHKALAGGTGYTVAQALSGHTPVLVLCKKGEPHLHVPGAYTLELPTTPAALLSTLQVLQQSGRQLRIARTQLQQQQEAQLIAHAKHALMARLHVDEAQAHAILQKRAMDARLRLAQAALLVLSAYGEAPPHGTS